MTNYLKPPSESYRPIGINYYDQTRMTSLVDHDLASNMNHLSSFDLDVFFLVIRQSDSEVTCDRKRMNRLYKSFTQFTFLSKIVLLLVLI